MSTCFAETTSKRKYEQSYLRYVDYSIDIHTVGSGKERNKPLCDGDVRCKTK